MMSNYNALKEEVTKYWKKEYDTEINGNKYGDGSYNPDTRVFSTRNGNWGYIVTKEIPPLTYADSWEIGTKFVYQGGVSIIGSSGGMWTNPWLSVQNGRMTISLTTYGETLAEGTWIDPPYYPSAGDLYEIKIGFTGDLYYVDYRRNGEGDFIRGWSRSSTDKEVYNTEPLWFLYGPDNSGYRGYADLYLKDTYVKINGEEWWRGVEAITVPATPDDYDYTTTNTEYKVPAETTIHYWKDSPEEVLANPNGLITTREGGGGWIIYTFGQWNELVNMLNEDFDPPYPRWQEATPNRYAYFKTPHKGIITAYTTKQVSDELVGRVCNHWIITGYESEADMLNLTNGIIIDDNGWSNPNKGEVKTITLSNNKSFEYYTIQMVNNFQGGSYCSMGTTKFYMKYMEKGTPDDYDFTTTSYVYKALRR